MTAAFAAAEAFFALPQEQKEQVPRANRFGFVANATMAIDQDRQLGKTEFLDMGLADEVVLPDLEGFEPAVRRYQRRALETGLTILGALASALDLDPDFFAARMTEPQCKLRMLHYAQADVGPGGELPVSTEPHTDYGAITMLATDGVPGLEVKPVAADWTSIEAPAGAIVVNLGDMLARWTNDRYRSTPHRVVGPHSSDRYTIPFFLNPDTETIVECLPSCVSADRPCRYQPVTAARFLAERTDSASEPHVDRAEGPIRRVTA